MYTDAEWMDEESPEFDNPPITAMWSEQSHLLCTIESSGRYYVLNGAWEGRRNGNDFEIIYHNEGNPKNTHITINDWQEVDLAQFVKENPEFSGYFGAAVLMKNI